MAKFLKDGSIRLNDGRIVYSDSILQAQDIIELIPLFQQAPAWPFVSGGGGGGFGVPGISGFSGMNGAAAMSGFSGMNGASGFSGLSGFSGFSGESGFSGFSGESGFSGFSGQGQSGFSGFSGISSSFLPFGRVAAVPAGGTLQLFSVGQATTAKRMNKAGTIIGASIQVNVVDAARAYNLDIRVNGVSVATLALPVSTLGASTVALAVAFVADDLITAFMVRTSGAGASTFGTESAQIEVMV